MWTFSVSWNERVADPSVPKGHRVLGYGRVLNFAEETTARTSHRWHLTHHDDWLPRGGSDPEVSELRRIEVGKNRGAAAAA